MKERIRELSEGRVEYRKPIFTITPEVIDAGLDVDGLHHFVVMIESDSSLQVKGVAYSSHSRVKVLTPTFFGRVNSINLEVNTMGLNPGTRLAGILTFETNAGERTVKYTFSMHEKNYGEDERVINTLEDFADFAREDEAGALHTFRSRAFTELPFMQDMNSMALYQVLMNEKDGRRNMEAFLTYHDAKPPVTYSLLKTSDSILEPTEPVKKAIEIKQECWGYNQLTVTTNSPFVALSKDKITTDDFDENGYYRFLYTLYPGTARSGDEKLEIVFHSAKKEIVFTLEIEHNNESYLHGGKSAVKLENVKLMNLVIEYRSSLIRSDGKNSAKVKKALAELIKYLEKEIESEESDWEKKLLLIYFYMKSDRIEDADKYLDEVREEVMKNRLVNVRAYCFFLFLRAEFYNSEEQMDTASKLINKYYTENGQDPALMLLLLRTDNTYVENPSLKILRLKELYNAGCISPLLYLETCDSYRRSPDLLRVLNDFERQAMFYGARHSLLSEDLVVSVARLCSYEDVYRPATYHLLVDMFEAYPIQIVLENICGYLIRTERKTEKNFKWFELGVKSGVSLLGINEAYIAALPKGWNKPLPKELLLYFSYSQNLRGDVRELLYENILTFEDEDSSIYKEYKSQMEEYALTQLLEGKFTRRLLPLYKKLLSGDMIDERLARVLPELLMTCEITCHHKDMRKVVVRCPELNVEDAYTLDDGKCCAPIYTDDCMIFFIDCFGNRYSDVAYEKELLFEDKTLLEKCENKYPDYLIFLLRRCKNILDHAEINDNEQHIMNVVLASAEVSEFFKMRLISRMLNQAVTRKIPMSDDILMSLNLKLLSESDKRKALICMVTNKHYSEVYEFIYKNGISGLGTETLLLLAENRIQKIKGEEEHFLVGLCKYLFDKGVNSVQVNAYLCSYYVGPSETMRAILFACGDVPAIVSDLPERTLGQMLFCDDSTDIKKVFDIYRRSQKINTNIVRAYEVYVCYNYFVNGINIDETVFSLLYDTLYGEKTIESIRKEYENIDIINISLLYYFTKNESVIPEQLSVCESLLKRLCQKGIMLGFYSLLWTKVAFPAELNGKVLLEHRGKGAVRAYCTYRKLDSDKKTTILMQKMYDGIFVAQLVLFADETIEYSISEEIDGELNVVVKKELLSNDMTFVRNGSSFETINEFSRMYASGQENQLEDALVMYEKKQHIVSSLFMPL